jgi:hypothetical protein
MNAGTVANEATGLMNAEVSEVEVTEAADVETPVKLLEGTDQGLHQEEVIATSVENLRDVKDDTVVIEADPVTEVDLVAETETVLIEGMEEITAIEMEETEEMAVLVNSEKVFASIVAKKVTSERTALSPTTVAAVVVTVTRECTRDHLVAEGEIDSGEVDSVEVIAVSTEEDRTETSNDAITTLPDQGVDRDLMDATTHMQDREDITESRESAGLVLLPGQDRHPDAGAREGTTECYDD